MKTFPKLQEFVDAASLFLRIGTTGSKTIFASDVRKDILKGLDGTNDQIYFDGIKQLLNTLDYSNLQIELIGKEYPKGHRRGAEFEKSRSLTSFYNNSIEVRNEIYNIMKLGGLKNNYPKNGFLCPYELEDVHEEDITADKQVKPQEPAKAIISKTDALNEVNNGVNTCKYKCTEKLPLIKIYKYLIDTDTIKKDISETQFINDCHNADFSKEYATGKRANMCYVATVLCDYYVPNEGINDDWRTAVTKSMGVDKNYIKGRNWSDLFADKFPLKRKN
jgi:hypothetical protein